MSSSKVLSFSASDLPKFDGRNYKVWLEKVTPYLMMANLIGVLDGTFVAPSPIAETKPDLPTSTGDAPATATEWSRYGVLIGQYNLQMDKYSKAKKEFDDQDLKAKGVLNMCLTPGIWDQIKKKSAAEAWTWLRAQYSICQFVETLEDFKFLITFKLDLSDPNPQLAEFQSHYSRLPEEKPEATEGQLAPASVPVVSQSMACLILISALPLAANPTQESVYQCTIEDFTAKKVGDTTTPKLVSSFLLDTLCSRIRDTWAARFNSIPEHLRPRKGTFYIQQNDKRLAPLKKTQAQKASAIKDKGKAPMYSDQQNAGSSQNRDVHAPWPSSSTTPKLGPPPPSASKKKHRRGPRKNHARTAAVDYEVDSTEHHFVIASPAVRLLDRISTPPPTALSPPPVSCHSVASFSSNGLIIRTTKEQKPWRAPGSVPYPVSHRARTLAERIGVMPTIQVLKNLEGVVKDTLGDKAYEPEEHAEPRALQLLHVHPGELSSVDDSMSDDEEDTLFASSVSSRDQASLAPTPAPSPDVSRAVTPEPNSAYYNPMDMDNAFMLRSPSPIAPFMTRSITPDPAIPIDWDALDTFGSNFVREYGQIDNMDDIDANDE